MYEDESITINDCATTFLKRAKIDYDAVIAITGEEGVSKSTCASNLVVESLMIDGLEAQEVMTQAYEQNGKIPYQIITDKLHSYQDGIRKTFRNWGAERKVKHTSILGRRRQINNNAIENHHTHQKEFQKVRRGINETQTYADGFKVFHNFVRKGVKDKLTPAQRCGIEVQGNKWETMLIKSLEVPQLTGEKNMAKSP